jgi:hypothetical protein
VKDQPQPIRWWTVLGEAGLLAMVAILAATFYQEIGPIFWAHEWGSATLWFHYFFGNVLFVLACMFLVCAACAFIDLTITFLAHLVSLITRRRRLPCPRANEVGGD